MVYLTERPIGGILYIRRFVVLISAVLSLCLVCQSAVSIADIFCFVYVLCVYSGR